MWYAGIAELDLRKKTKNHNFSDIHTLSLNCRQTVLQTSVSAPPKPQLIAETTAPSDINIIRNKRGWPADNFGSPLMKSGAEVPQIGKKEMRSSGRESFPSLFFRSFEYFDEECPARIP
jgi:hypothetical protein